MFWFNIPVNTDCRTLVPLMVISKMVDMYVVHLTKLNVLLSTIYVKSVPIQDKPTMQKFDVQCNPVTFMFEWKFI